MSWQMRVCAPVGVRPKRSNSMPNHAYTAACTAWYLSQSSAQGTPSSSALVSVAVPYSSVPHTKTALCPRERQYRL